MKKSVYIAAIMFFAAVFCAKDAAGQHYVGVRGGYGGGSARFYPYEDMKYLWGMTNAGLSWKYYGVERGWSGIQVDVEFMQRGFQMIDHKAPAGSEIASDSMAWFKTNSVIIPFSWQPHAYFFNRKLIVFLNAAVTASYNFSAKQKTGTLRYDVLTEGAWTKREYIINRDNRFGFGLMGGLGVGYITGRFEVFVEGRYHFGYSDIFKNMTVYPTNPSRSPLDNINLSAGVFYRISNYGILAAPKVKKSKEPSDKKSPAFERGGQGRQ